MDAAKQSARYSSIAVSLHWLIAFFIVGLIVLGKISEELADDDPLRFDLIQWHKSLGIAVLLLVVFRILWRLTHKPPSLPEHMSGVERFAAGLGHFGLYCLMLAMPLTGWALVSSSPLDLATELFGVIPWPHIPLFKSIADKSVWEHRFYTAHYWLANVLIALVVLHIIAALRHHFLVRDGLLARMTIARDDQYSGLLFGGVLAAAGILSLAGLTGRASLSVAELAGTETVEQRSAVVAGKVGFSASQLGDPLNGVFTEFTISLQLDTDKPDEARLEATVQTGSVSTGDGQVDSTLVTATWFASAEHPTATFLSDNMVAVADEVYEVSGILTIRGVSQPVTFSMRQIENHYAGEFTINRRDFGIGVGGQDKFVAPEVSVSFRFTQ